MRIGYARVSSYSQNLARQIKILKENGAEKIYKEKESGRRNDRPVLAEVVSKLKSGDTLVIVETERLGRDSDYLDDLRYLVRRRKANLLSLDMPNFEYVEDENMKKMLDTVFWAVKGFTAADEWIKIRRRQAQGIELAKKRGAFKGKPIKYGPNAKSPEDREKYEAAVNLLRQGKTAYAIAKSLNISNTVVYRIKREID